MCLIFGAPHPLLALVVLLLSVGQRAALRKRSVNEQQLQTIESYLDLSEDPCENFYEYACGSWAERHSTEHYSETTGLIDHKVNKRLIDLFEAYVPKNDSADVYDKVWTYYRSCRREKKHKFVRYLQYVRPAGHYHWPLLQPAKGAADGRFNWLLTLAKLRRYGLKGALIDHLVLQKQENATEYIIDLDKPALDGHNKLPGWAVVGALLVKLGVAKLPALKLAHALLAFETKVQKLLEIEDEYGLLEVSLRELRDDLPQLPWRKYLRIVLGRPIDEDYVLQIRNWNYFVGLLELVQATDPQLLCNYIMFKFVYYLSADSTSSFSKVDCMVDVRSKMDLALNFIYYEHFYSAQAADYNAEVQQLLAVAKRQFAAKLAENVIDLSAAELRFLHEKLQTMQLNIGNLPANVSAAFVRAYYGHTHLSPKHYYRNQLALLELRARMEHAQLDAPQLDFFIADSDTARSSTPFYLMRRNRIVVPFGILQPPIFHRHMHDVLKMSLLGFLLTHELVHGFDASGLAFDHAGNAHELGINITENARFGDALRCMQRDETESIDERIADIAGVRLAYDALFGANGTLRAQQPHFSPIPVRRLFFLNLAQFFCGNLAAEFMDHDSDNVRLQQTLLNFEPFAEEFQCDLGDTMHPEQKCRLW